MTSRGWVLTEGACCHYKKGDLDTEGQHVRTKGADSHLHVKERGLRRDWPWDTLTLEVWPPDCETIVSAV